MPELVRNLGSYALYCPWCDNTGQLPLREWETLQNQNGGEYVQQVEAPCGFCELGHQRHARHGGRWHYAMEDVDIIYSDQLADHLSDDVARKLQRLSEEFAIRRSQMQIPKPRPGRLDADAYAETGPSPGTLTAAVDQAEPLHPDMRNEGAEP